MDSSIRRIPDDHLRSLPTSSRQNGESADFYLEEDDEDEEEEVVDEEGSAPPVEDRPVAPRLDGETGGQVDLTA